MILNTKVYYSRCEYFKDKKEFNHCYGIDTVDWNEILGKKDKNKNLKTKEIFRELKKAERKYNKKLKKFSSDNPKSNIHSLGVDCSDASG